MNANTSSFVSVALASQRLGGAGVAAAAGATCCVGAWTFGSGAGAAAGAGAGAGGGGDWLAQPAMTASALAAMTDLRCSRVTFSPSAARARLLVCGRNHTPIHAPIALGRALAS